MIQVHALGDACPLPASLRTGGGSIGSAAPNVRWMFPPKNNGSDLRLQIRAVVPCRAFCVAAAAM